MIPPVRTDSVWGRAQSGPVPPEGGTAPGPRLAVLDRTGLVWTSPNKIIFIDFNVDPKHQRSETDPNSDTMSLHNNHLLRSELLSMEKCDKVVMDFPVTSDVGTFAPKWAE